MVVKKKTVVVSRRKKFQSVSIPMAHLEIELIGNSVEELEGKTVKLDLTRQLKGKGIEATFKVSVKDGKATANPKKILLMSGFIRRMIRKRISYVEDSFSTPTQESMVIVKPFLITRKKVSKAVRRTLRNLTKNWIEDEFARMKDIEIFNEIISNSLQKALSIKLKKTYPLSLCEIRVMEIVRPLEEKEIPKVKPKPKIEDKVKESNEEEYDVAFAEKEIKETQSKASDIQESKDKSETEISVSESTETEDKDEDSSAKAEEGEESKDEDSFAEAKEGETGKDDDGDKAEIKEDVKDEVKEDEDSNKEKEESEQK